MNCYRYGIGDAHKKYGAAVTMSKKYLVLPAVLILAAVVVTTVSLWPTELKKRRQQN